MPSLGYQSKSACVVLIYSFSGSNLRKNIFLNFVKAEILWYHHPLQGNTSLKNCVYNKKIWLPMILAVNFLLAGACSSLGYVYGCLH